MGNVWSRSEPQEQPQHSEIKTEVVTTTTTTVVKEESAFQVGVKRPVGDKGEVKDESEHLGPREPRIPKKKVALLVGFNGTGYQGMQL
mgnify:CR=1 FL=1